MVLNNVALDLSVQSFAVKLRIPTNYFTMRKIKASENNNFWKRGNNFFKSYLFLFCYQVSNVNHRISGLERAFCPPKLSHSPDNFFITTSRFSTTVLFWQNATLSNI